MIQNLYVASTNPGKLRDFRVAATDHALAILPLPGIQQIDAPPEDAPTYAGNAQGKALYYSQFLPGEMVLADDSGIEVAALNGAPGVRSARYASDGGFHAAEAADANNNLFLLHELRNVPDSDRQARYCCALAVAKDGAILLNAFGTTDGVILTAERGSRGFGYDPLFFLPGLGLTMAELDEPTRWNLSHRGQAFRELLARFSANS